MFRKDPTLKYKDPITESKPIHGLVHVLKLQNLPELARAVQTLDYISGQVNTATVAIWSSHRFIAFFTFLLKNVRECILPLSSSFFFF